MKSNLLLYEHIKSRQYTKGVYMNRWDELPEDFYQVDNSEMNSHRIGFLQSLGIDTNNIPNCFYEKFIWLNEMNIFVNKTDGKYEVVYIKDVVGTTHKFVCKTYQI